MVRGLLRGDERFAVTGASGWLGRTALELLAEVLEPVNLGEQVAGYASEAKTVSLQNGCRVPLRPLQELPTLVPAPTHILHFAYLTRDRLADLGVAAYARANIAISTTLAGAVERLRPRGVFSISSGAVYGPGRVLHHDVESEPYGSLKHVEEMVLRQAADDAASRSVTARVFSLSGPYMTKPALYALGDLILQAMAPGPVVIHARHPVHRSYCAAADVVALGLASLMSDDDPVDMIFDSGGEVVELGQLAEAVLRVLGRPHTAVRRSWDLDADPDRYVGDGATMSRLAARHGLRLQPLDEQVRTTAAYLIGTRGSE